MIWYAVKVLVSALIIVIISEVSKKLPLLGSLIASLPLVSVLGMIWLYGETRDSEKLATHAFGTFWYVLPSLPIFPITLAAGITLTVFLYVLMIRILAKFGMSL
jgi:F0F1-type ATP synthase assembly protein I